MYKGRVGIVVFFFIVFFLIIMVRIFSISVFPDKRLGESIKIATTRGVIFDRFDHEMAVPSAYYALYARPKILSDNKKKYYTDIFLKTGIITPYDMTRLNSDSGFVYLKRRISIDNGKYLSDMINDFKNKRIIKNDEFGIIEEPGRFYYYSPTSGIIGFTGVDNNGLMGLEYTMNSHLSNGFDVYTSIDPTVSTVVYEELVKGLVEYKAQAGSVAIIDLNSHEVLSLVSYPGFNPNNPEKSNNGGLTPMVLGHMFEPGSVMKQFSAAFALENKKVQPHYPLFNCTSSHTIRDHTFTGPAYGNIDLTEIIQKSCNIGMVKVANLFSKKQYYSFLSSLGFGSKPSLPLTEMQAGILRPTEQWSYLSKYMLAIGQEIGVTTVQLAIAASVIGSDGLYITPRLIRKVSVNGGTNVYKLQIETNRVISSHNAKMLLQMMRKVVSENGTAIKARVEGISVAGKTGTGQIAKEKSKGYYEHLYNAVFIGYVPAENPQMVIVVAVHKPRIEKHTGGDVAAPIFANILRRIITSTAYFKK